MTERNNYPKQMKGDLFNNNVRMQGDLFDDTRIERASSDPNKTNLELAERALRDMRIDQPAPRPLRGVDDIGQRQKEFGLEVDEGTVDIRARAAEQREMRHRPKAVDDEDFSEGTYLRPL